METSVPEMVSPCVAWTPEEDVPAPEEGLKEIVRIKLLLVEVIPLLEVFLCAMLIIDALLFRVVETRKCCAYLLEGIGGIRSSILIRVELKCKLLVGSLDLIL
jgi:hypothetical protein